MISVVTATYNRAHTLPKLYQSLIENKKTYPYFEWVIIDDGSFDTTKQLVEEWMKEEKIKIRYYRKRNGGKMDALNVGIPKTKGDIIVEVDSDDSLETNAFTTIMEYWDEVEANDKLYGALFRRSFEDKELDAKNEFPFDKKISTMFDLYMKTDFDKDAVPVFKGDIRRKFKHQLEHHEKFVTEARMYNEIDRNYDGLLCINKPVVICEYLNDGYSKNIDQVFKKNPYGYHNYFQECLTMNLNKLPFKKRLYLIKHYILFSYLTEKKKGEVIKEAKGIMNKLLVIFLVWPGYIVSKKKFPKE